MLEQTHDSEILLRTISRGRLVFIELDVSMTTLFFYRRVLNREKLILKQQLYLLVFSVSITFQLILAA